MSCQLFVSLYCYPSSFATIYMDRRSQILPLLIHDEIQTVLNRSTTVVNGFTAFITQRNISFLLVIDSYNTYFIFDQILNSYKVVLTFRTSSCRKHSCSSIINPIRTISSSFRIIIHCRFNLDYQAIFWRIVRECELILIWKTCYFGNRVCSRSRLCSSSTCLTFSIAQIRPLKCTESLTAFVNDSSINTQIRTICRQHKYIIIITRNSFSQEFASILSIERVGDSNLFALFIRCKCQSNPLIRSLQPQNCIDFRSLQTNHIGFLKNKRR